MAITQMSRSKGKKFIQAFSKKKKAFEELEANKLQLYQNEEIKFANLDNIGVIGSEALVLANWKNLVQLDLSML